MTARLSMPALRSRLDALPVDRAPLRRAGLLGVLLVALLAAGAAFGPDRAATLAPAADRQELLAEPESVSATRPAPGWTGGRVIAVLLLVVGGGIAVVLHRRRAPAAGGRATLIDVMETHPLGPGQSLQLVACGEEVLLLCVGGEQTRLLRHWPRAQAEAAPLDFAEALALATAPAADALAKNDASTADWLAGVLAASAPAASAPAASAPAVATPTKRPLPVDDLPTERPLPVDDLPASPAPDAPGAPAPAVWPVAPAVPPAAPAPVSVPERPQWPLRPAPSPAPARGLHQFGGV